MNWVLLGWILFIMSAVFFILASLKAGDMLAFAGSSFFLVACFAFLVPLLRK